MPLLQYIVAFLSATLYKVAVPSVIISNTCFPEVSTGVSAAMPVE